jgi:hypothetical protein
MIMPGIIKNVGDFTSESQFQALIEEMAKEVDGIGDTAKFRREAVDLVRKLQQTAS